MIENIHQLDSLLSIARRKSKMYDVKPIHPSDLGKYKSEGWELLKEFKNTIQIKRIKQHGYSLEDRVWSLFYKMNFLNLSGNGGAKLIINPKDENSPKSQIDIVAIDEEVALAIECKSSLEYKKRSQFQEELGKFSMIRDPFIKSIKAINKLDILTPKFTVFLKISIILIKFLIII